MHAEAIRYLHRDEIDIVKWDTCIDNASNGLIYGYSFYLDTMAKHWDALVLGDHKAVMPLPWNSKYGIRYIYQPFITAQLGVFGKTVNAQLAGDFIDAIPVSFRLAELSLNPAHAAAHGMTKTRKNFVLDLDHAYEIIAGRYNENTKRNLKKAAQAGLHARKQIDPEKIISLALTQMKGYGAEPADNLSRFRALNNLLEKKRHDDCLRDILTGR